MSGRQRLFLGLCLAATMLAPSVSFAVVAPTTFAQLVNIFLSIVQLLIIFVGALSLVSFMWGLARFILSSGDEKGHAEGARFMLWGIIALFVMASAWGLVSILSQTLGVPTFIPFLPV